MALLPPIVKIQADKDKRFIICSTRDIKEDEMVLFREYGIIKRYDEKLYANLNLQEIVPWQYMIFDMRESSHRYTYLKQIATNKDIYHIIEYSFNFEKDQLTEEAENRMSSFPKAQPNKECFDLLLLQQRIDKPRWWKSLLFCALNLYEKVK